MAYTAFRKSYGDFEVVIPPVDFSTLTIDEAAATVRRLKTYEDGFVCHHLLPLRQTQAATIPIENMLKSHAGSECASVAQLVRRKLELNNSYFLVYNNDAIALRKAWCEHLAREIELEYGLKPHPYVLEEH